MAVPVLDILDGKGGLRTHTTGVNEAGIQVLAVMSYPSDELKRNEMIMAGIQDALQESDRATPPNISKTVFARGAEGIQKDFDRALKGGQITGETLLCLRRLAEHRPQDATLSRARYLVEMARIATGTQPSNEKSLRVAWNNFKTVSHLWAAFVDCRGNDEFLGHDRLAEFLGLADLYARFAIRYRSPGATEPMFANAAEIWEIPFFEGLPIGELHPTAPSLDELRWLVEYVNVKA